MQFSQLEASFHKTIKKSNCINFYLIYVLATIDYSFVSFLMGNHHYWLDWLCWLVALASESLGDRNASESLASSRFLENLLLPRAKPQLRRSEFSNNPTEPFHSPINIMDYAYGYFYA